MSDLLALQRAFQAYVLGRADTVLPRVAGSAAGSAAERLRIYAEGMQLRFQEVLGEEYPGLRRLLGDEAFAAVSRSYTDAHPSHHPSIRWFGRHLHAHLAVTMPWARRPALAEMACFEWAKGELVDAADDETVSVEQIAALAPEAWAGMHPRPVSALRRLELHHDVPAAWSALQAGEAPPALEQRGPARAWLLWRNGLVVHWRSLEADEAWALDACGGARGTSFAALCEGLCRWTGEAGAPLRAATLLKQWASDRVLRAV